MSLINNYCKHGYENASGCRPCGHHDFSLPYVAVFHMAEFNGAKYVPYDEVMEMKNHYWNQIRILEEEIKKGLS